MTTTATANPSTDFSVEPLAGSPVSDLGEGPHWDEARQELLYIDAFVGDVHRYEAATKRHHKINLGDLVTIVIPVEGKRDQYLVSLRNKVIFLGFLNQFDLLISHFQVIHLTWNLTDGTHSHKVLAEVASERRGKERFNDGKVDALGRLWIGTLLNAEDGSVVPGAGSLYKLDTANGSFTKMSSNFTLSNGMAWNANNTLMYFNDSEDRKTYVFDFDLPSGTISKSDISLCFYLFKTFLFPNQATSASSWTTRRSRRTSMAPASTPTAWPWTPRAACGLPSTAADG